MRGLLRWIMSRTASRGTGEAGLPALWSIQPPDGVRLVRSHPAKTGEGGRGLVAYYSDGTTASAMRNSDGSMTILLFRKGESVPAVPLETEGPQVRFTWSRA
jgi:hypothetical protein